MIKVAINGAGRIGRCLIRLLLKKKNFEITNINDPYLTPQNLTYLLNYDSVYGRLGKKAISRGTKIIFDHNKIVFSKDKKFLNKIKKKSIDFLIDASGIKINHNLIYKNKNETSYKSLITHTYEKADIQHIYGVNDSKYDQKKHNIISTSICDAVAIGPVISLILKKYGLVSGSILTLHPWLGYQNLVDGPSRSFAYPGEVVENFSLGRASTEALISKKTSCISALNNVIPNLQTKISSMSFRVPTQIVSSAYLNLNLKKKIKLSEVKKAFNEFSKNQINKIFYINKDQCISKDFIANPYSSIIDDRWTEVKNGNLRLLIWYDNEFGYSSRVIDLIQKISNEKF